MYAFIDSKRGIYSVGMMARVLGISSRSYYDYTQGAESFFKTLKCELIYGNRTLTPMQLELELFEYIEIWYNKIRRHSALKNMTIDEFWKLNKKVLNFFCR